MTDPVFFDAPRPISVSQIIELTGAELRPGDDPATMVDRVAPLGEGGKSALVYAEGKRKAGLLERLDAAAIFVTDEIAPLVPKGIAALIVKRPVWAFSTISRFLYPGSVKPIPVTAGDGISPHAVIDPTARLEPGAVVEAGAVIGRDAMIGSGTVVAPNAVIGRSCQIGRGCYIGCNTSVRHALIGDGVILHDGVRVGQDGFGYTPGLKGLEKVPQIGRVIIQNDVEIGANSTIDRGALGDTVIGEGTKIDNLVQIAHNVHIGRSCAIAGSCGISGSVNIGDGVMLGGQVGVADHVTIGDGVQIAASSGVMHDIPAGERWAGSPAKPAKEAFREMITLRVLAKSKHKGNKSE